MAQYADYESKTKLHNVQVLLSSCQKESGRVKRVIQWNGKCETMQRAHGFKAVVFFCRATPSNIPKQASCRLYKNSGSGEMRLMV